MASRCGPIRFAAPDQRANSRLSKEASVQTLNIRELVRVTGGDGDLGTTTGDFARAERAGPLAPTSQQCGTLANLAGVSAGLVTTGLCGVAAVVLTGGAAGGVCGVAGGVAGLAASSLVREHCDSTDQ
jgi:hypothetical protein